ncbi:putative rhamnogalacturonate lyase A [Rhizoctonia solani 123E]|uniref:Putative rhamnogalacturonate lyase A n=1 Tax=Rhizoctonia solani 123E TaxID=1423351 RepID=A0A074RPF2_9AGAM|nr:putative rhamnogalacturonate lyase A [Rhizoctonia solani 123E]
MRFASLLPLAGLPTAFAAFGVTSGSGYIDVNTGNKLVYRVSTSSGDITSIKYNSVEYQYSKKYTQIASGLGTATVSYKVSGNYITITIATSTLTQYYVAVSGQDALYVGIYTTAEPEIGELRFIARLNADLLAGPTAEFIALLHVHTGGTAIEDKDVFTVSGQTRSKLYSSVRFIEDKVHGVTGSGVGVYVVIPGNRYERSSGGPFYRDIDNQSTSSQHTLLDMNPNHEPTESYRTGFFGRRPYALVFTTGSVPSSSLDLSFFEGLGLAGYVAASGRGTVSGTVSGVSSSFAAVVGLSNSAAQYRSTASGGSFSILGVKPGTYTATLYKKELEVATGSVTVAAGKTTTLS